MPRRLLWVLQRPGARQTVPVRIVLLVNSAASSVTGRRRVVIQKALSADHEVRLAETARRGHATRLARSAAAEGADVVVVLGGDGTLNEAANGLVGTDTALAALPGGSTNVFARIIGLADDPIEGAGQVLDALEHGAVTKIGLGVAGGRYFLFHCGIGFDAAVVEQVERRGPWKRWAGHPLFIYAALDTWRQRVHRRRHPMRVINDTGETLAQGLFTVVLNADPYTYLGSHSLKLVPTVTLQDPLAVVILPSLALRRLLPVAVRALGAGDVRDLSAATVNTGLKDLTVIAEPPVPYQMDGDYVGTTERLHLRWAPQALRLVMPSPPTATNGAAHNHKRRPWPLALLPARATTTGTVNDQSA